MAQQGAHLEMAVAAIGIFVNDGTIDSDELNRLMKMAWEDGVLDENEKRVLLNIFDRVDRTRVTPDVWMTISRIREDLLKPAKP